MVCDRRVDMHRVDVWVLEQLVVVGVSHRDAEFIAARVQFFLVATADRVHFGEWMGLIDRNELRAKPQSYHGHSDLTIADHCRFLSTMRYRGVRFASSLAWFSRRESDALF